MTLKAAIFDWDGTITDSNDVKTQTFIDIFAGAGSTAKEYIADYQKNHGGISRFEKYRHYMQQFFNRAPTEAELRQFGFDYARLCRQKLLQTPFMPGASKTLNRLHAAGIPAYVVTGSPPEEIRSLALERGILHLFTDIFGSPQSKTFHLGELLSRNRLSPQDTVFFGDALADYEAAQANQIPFIGICPYPEASPFPLGTKVLTQIQLKI